MKHILLFSAVILLTACTRTEYITYQMQRTDSLARAGSVVQTEFDTIVFTHFRCDTLRDSVRVVRAHHTHTVDTVREVRIVTVRDTTTRAPAPLSSTISKIDVVAAQIATFLVIVVIIGLVIVVYRLILGKRRP